MRQQRRAVGSVRFDKRRGTWNYLFYDQGKRRSKLIGTKRDYPTKAAAWKAAESVRPVAAKESSPTVQTLVEQYRAEKMPQRFSTARGYECWLRNHVLPRWGASPIQDVQARPVDLWLRTLELSPKSRAHIRTLISTIWDYAQWRGDVPTERNPMELVRIKDASKRRRKPRSLTVEEFRLFALQLAEPFRTIALVSVCFGLRISECLALKWSNVNWLDSKLSIQRGIVRHRVDDVKTVYSERAMSVDAEMLSVLKAWKQVSQFSANEDWAFASPSQLGRQPWSYDAVLDAYLRASEAAGIGRVGTHTMRHTYRSWLDAVGTTIAVQQKLMRHADIRTTMNVYGDVVTDEMSRAHGKVVGLALNGAQTERKPS